MHYNTINLSVSVKLMHLAVKAKDSDTNVLIPLPTYNHDPYSENTGHIRK